MNHKKINYEGKNMKRIIGLFLVLVLTFCVSGCSGEEVSLEGEGESYIFNVSGPGICLSMYGGSGNITRDTLKIKEKDSLLYFKDRDYSGVCEVAEDGKLILKRQEIVEGGYGDESSITEAAELFYIRYKNYLILDQEMDMAITEGELPYEENTNCSIEIFEPKFRDYKCFFSFSQDGTCELICENKEDTYCYEGTYKLDGKIAMLTFRKGECNGSKFNGKTERMLYIDEGKIYFDVYKKRENKE